MKLNIEFVWFYPNLKSITDSAYIIYLKQNNNLPLNGWNDESSINSVCSMTWKVKSTPSSDVFVTSPQYKKWSLLTTRPLKSD